jgi:hypothetical protein
MAVTRETTAAFPLGMSLRGWRRAPSPAPLGSDRVQPTSRMGGTNAAPSASPVVRPGWITLPLRTPQADTGTDRFSADPRHPAPPRGRGQETGGRDAAAGPGGRPVRVKGQRRKEGLSRGLRECGGRGWGAAGRRGGREATGSRTEGWRQALGSSPQLRRPLPAGAVAQALAALGAHPEAAAVYGEGHHIHEEDWIRRPVRRPCPSMRIGCRRPSSYVDPPSFFDLTPLNAPATWTSPCAIAWSTTSGRSCPGEEDPDPRATLSRQHPPARRPEEIGPTRQGHAEILLGIYNHFGRVAPSLAHGYARS